MSYQVFSSFADANSASLRVLVNGRSQQFMGGLNGELHDGNRIALIYPYTENF